MTLHPVKEAEIVQALPESEPVSQLPESVSQPPKPVSQPPEPYFQPPDPVPQPPEPVSQPPKLWPVSQLPESVSKPPKLVSQPPKLVSQPHEPYFQPPDPVPQPKPVSQPPEPVSQPPESVSQPPESVSQPPKLVSQPPKPVSQPPEPYFQPPDSAPQPPKPVSQPPDPVSQPPEQVLQPSIDTQLPQPQLTLPITSTAAHHINNKNHNPSSESELHNSKVPIKDDSESVTSSDKNDKNFKKPSRAEPFFPLRKSFSVSNFRSYESSSRVVSDELQQKLNKRLNKEADINALEKLETTVQQHMGRSKAIAENAAASLNKGEHDDVIEKTVSLLIYCTTCYICS